MDLYMKLMLLLPVVSLVQSYIDSINRIVFFGFFIVGLYLLSQSLRKNQFIFLFIAFISYLIVYFSSSSLEFSSSKVYYINWILYSSYMAYNKDEVRNWLYQNEHFVRMIMWIWTVAVVISIPFASSWFEKEASGTYFSSFTDSSFRLCPTALFICALALISISLYKRKKDIFFMIVPLFCGLMGSSRTYFIVILCAFLIGLYFNAGKRVLKFAAMLIPVLIIGLSIYSYTSLSTKVQYTLDDNQYGDFWFRITSSRSVIWTRQLEAFANLSPLRKFFGGGFGFTNSAASHYAHNDFIEVLCNHGILGLVIYLLAMINLFRSFMGVYKKNKIAYALCIAIWLLNAMFNMFYYYICTALCFPLILIAIESENIEEYTNDICDLNIT